MTKFNLNGVIKSVSGTVQKRLPEILIGLGVIGMGSAVVLTAKAAPKAVESINEKKKRVKQRETYGNGNSRSYLEILYTGCRYYTCICCMYYRS